MGGSSGSSRLGNSSVSSLSNAARRLASANNFESLMRNLSSNPNMASRTGLSNNNNNNNNEGSGGGINATMGSYGSNSNSNNNNVNNNNNNAAGGGGSSTTNLQSLLQSINNNSGGGNGGLIGNSSMSSLLGGHNNTTSAASLANLLRVDQSSTGLSALRDQDGLTNRNTTSVEDFLSLVAAGDIPHQDPAMLNNPLNQLQLHLQLQQ